MSLLDFFKNKPSEKKVVIKCSRCFLPLSDNFREVDGKKLCNECYNKTYFINTLPQNKVDKYTIGLIHEKNRWLFILFNGKNERDDPTPFADLLKKIAANSNKGEWRGNFIPVGEGRFMIKNDKLPLVYQFDGLFGIVIEYPENERIDNVLQHLKNIASIELEIKS